jgi:hypothetical protein
MPRILHVYAPDFAWVGHGFCVWMTRIAREGDDSDFACREVGEAAVGRGFSGVGVWLLGGFGGSREFVAALPGHFHLAWRNHPTLVRALGLDAFELPCS